MQITARPLAPGEIDCELLTLTVSLGSLGLAVAWFALHLPWPICVFHALTGHPCATCGATRSAIAFFHADFLTAWKWNPLAFIAYCGLTAFNIYAFVVLVTGTKRLRVFNVTDSEKRFIRIALFSLIAVNWTYLLVHTSNF